jgi:predicted aconitase
VTLNLTARDRDYLSGSLGSGAQLAMRVVVRLAQAMGAASLTDVTSAHVDSCYYVGDAGIAYAQRLVAGGARVAVPTTLNVGSVDLLHPELNQGDSDLAAKGRELMRLYEEMGCTPTWTCAPYQLPHRPAFGDHVVWGESNAIVFANSVLGARTLRNGDFVDIACAIVGRAPLAGLYLDSGRAGQVLVGLGDVPPGWRTEDAFFPLLGLVVGRTCGSRIPVVEGVDVASEDQLKAFGAAAASAGAVALFHMVGVTPEAPTRTAALGGGLPQSEVTIGRADLEQAWRELCTGGDGRLGAVCVGTPQFSISEFASLVELIGDEKVWPGVKFYVNAGRHVFAEARAHGWVDRLRAAGVTIVVDTCTYNTPILGRVDGLVMTNSAKWAWYAPRNIGARVVFSDLRTCVRAAVEGRVIDDQILL